MTIRERFAAIRSAAKKGLTYEEIQDLHHLTESEVRDVAGDILKEQKRNRMKALKNMIRIESLDLSTAELATKYGRCEEWIDSVLNEGPILYLCLHHALTMLDGQERKKYLKRVLNK